MKNLLPGIPIIIFSCFLFTEKTFSQNLVPNPSFEIYVTCPDNASQIQYAVNWFPPTWGTPDYFNSCYTTGITNVDIPSNVLGYQNAYFGNGYAGLFAAYPWPDYPDYREYIEVKLDSTLEAGIKYYVRFFVSLSDSSVYSTDDIGIVFTQDSLYSDTSYIIDAIPQINNQAGNFISDKFSWIKIEGEYIASGNEKFITIGNFKRNNLTDTLFVGSVTSPVEYGAYYYIDNICISRDSSFCNFPNGITQFTDDDFYIYPNPSVGLIKINSQNYEFFEVFIYNSIGELIYNENINEDNEIDISNNPDGIYYGQFVSMKNQKTIHKKIIITGLS